tara:strand:+ start:410 stop:706 length:297 start_codon:yes stop_codon:yes gene_type:complete
LQSVDDAEDGREAGFWTNPDLLLETWALVSENACNSSAGKVLDLLQSLCATKRFSAEVASKCLNNVYELLATSGDSSAEYFDRFLKISSCIQAAEPGT